MHGFVQKVHRRIQEKRLFQRDDHLILAVSGGPDSVSMVRALCALRYRVTLAWVDHGTRESAREEGRLVESLAEAQGVSFVALRAYPKNHSEVALRDARYEVLSSWLGTTSPRHMRATRLRLY